MVEAVQWEKPGKAFWKILEHVLGGVLFLLSRLIYKFLEMGVSRDLGWYPTYCRCQVECGAKEIVALGWGNWLRSQSWGLPAQGRKLVLGHKLLYSGGLELVGADPLPWGPAEARRLGAGVKAGGVL